MRLSEAQKTALLDCWREGRLYPIVGERGFGVEYRTGVHSNETIHSLIAIGLLRSLTHTQVQLTAEGIRQAKELEP